MNSQSNPFETAEEEAEFHASYSVWSFGKELEVIKDSAKKGLLNEQNKRDLSVVYKQLGRILNYVPRTKKIRISGKNHQAS